MGPCLDWARIWIFLTIWYFVISLNWFTLYKVPSLYSESVSTATRSNSPVPFVANSLLQIQTWRFTTGEKLEVSNCPVTPVGSQQVGGLICKCILQHTQTRAPSSARHVENFINTRLHFVDTFIILGVYPSRVDEVKPGVYKVFHMSPWTLILNIKRELYTM